MKYKRINITAQSKLEVVFKLPKMKKIVREFSSGKLIVMFDLTLSNKILWKKCFKLIEGEREPRKPT